MTVVKLDDYLFALKRSPAMQRELLTDPASHLAGLNLPDELKEAILSHDIAALYRLGAHPLLIAPFSRTVGIPPQEYASRMRPLVGSRPFRSEPR